MYWWQYKSSSLVDWVSYQSNHLTQIRQMIQVNEMRHNYHNRSLHGDSYNEKNDAGVTLKQHSIDSYTASIEFCWEKSCDCLWGPCRFPFFWWRPKFKSLPATRLGNGKTPATPPQQLPSLPPPGTEGESWRQSGWAFVGRLFPWQLPWWRVE